MLTPAQQALAAAHVPFARRIATGYARRCPRETDDILGAAMLGLVKAAGKYDQGKGTAFTTYAARRIRGEILDLYRLSNPRHTTGGRLVTADDPDWFDTLPASPDNRSRLASWGSAFEMVKHLPTQHRLVVNPKHAHGWEIPAIAELMGVRPGRVYVLARQAYDMLYAHLTGHQR